jgi:transcriptional regulator with XRE-family HTH domain
MIFERDKRLLGEKLKMLRYDLGLTVEEMSQKIGITPRTLHSYEKNESPISEKTLVKIRNTFNVDLMKDNTNNVTNNVSNAALINLLKVISKSFEIVNEAIKVFIDTISTKRQKG